jgi:predicted ATPase
MAFYWAAFTHLLRREWKRAKELAEAGLVLSEEHGFGMWSALLSIVLGRALAQSRQYVKGIALMEKGIGAAQARGFGPPDETIGARAEAYGQLGQTTEALQLIEEALAEDKNAERYSTEPELRRIKGELLLLKDRSSPVEAEQCFRTAIEQAQRHEAKSWELRATMSLARLLAKQGRRDEARTILAEIYNWFTEGFDTADLKEAKALLHELSD